MGACAWVAGDALVSGVTMPHTHVREHTGQAAAAAGKYGGTSSAHLLRDPAAAARSRKCDSKDQALTHKGENVDSRSCFWVYANSFSKPKCSRLDAFMCGFVFFGFSLSIVLICGR